MSRPAPVGRGRGLLTGLVGPRRMVGDRIARGCNRRHAATGGAGSRLVVAGDHRPLCARPHRWTGRVGASRRVGDASRGAPPGGSGGGSELGGDDDRRPGGGGDRPPSPQWNMPRTGQTAEDPTLAPPFPKPPHVTRVTPPGDGRPRPSSARAPATIGRGCLLAHTGGRGQGLVEPAARPPRPSAPSSEPAPPHRQQQRVEVPSEHVVVPGDNLWLIAERHLEQVTGRERPERPRGGQLLGCGDRGQPQPGPLR